MAGGSFGMRMTQRGAKAGADEFGEARQRYSDEVVRWSAFLCINAGFCGCSVLRSSNGPVAELLLLKGRLTKLFANCFLQLARRFRKKAYLLVYNHTVLINEEQCRNPIHFIAIL